MSTSLVIVALPAEDELVNKISSEKVPHLTLMYLGEESEDHNVARMAQFVEHALNISEHGPFYLDVDYRGELGDDKADVLFFNGGWEAKWIKSLRGQLLQQADIRTAFEKSDQFPDWVPHLTLGYPEAPAKPLPDDYHKIYGVQFDRIAVWNGNYEGPEFRLKWPEREDYGEAAVAWSTQEAGAAFVLEHYGVKGMKWGQRKSNAARETNKGMFDPEKHDAATDVVKSVLWPMIPPLGLFAIPAQVRLVRGGVRAANAKLVDMEEKRFQARAQSEKNFLEIHNRSTERFNREIGGINKKYPGDLTKNATAKKRYDKETETLLRDSYQEAARSIGNKNRTMHLDLELKPNGKDFVIKAKEGRPTPIAKRMKEVEHAFDDEIEFEVTLEFAGKVKRDPTGHILGFDFEGIEQKQPEESATHTVDRGREFIEHYGVKGMQWGVRKAPPSPVSPVAVSRVPHGTRRKTKIEVEGGENHDATEDAIKVAQSRAKLAKSGTAALSNRELQEVANRIELEARVKRAVQPAGVKFVSNILRTQGRQTTSDFVGRQVKKKLSPAA